VCALDGRYVNREGQVRSDFKLTHHQGKGQERKSSVALDIGYPLHEATYLA
jgi:hypothetical protein